jgi:hypothetical protein
MASITPIDAPRGNARRSAGPCHPDACSAAPLHPLLRYLPAADLLIPGEDPVRFETLAGAYDQVFQPRDPVETHFTASLLLCDWRERRYTRLEAAIFSRLAAGQPPACPTFAGQFVASGGSLPLLFRLIDGNRRAYHRALKSLLQLQKGRPGSPPDRDLEPVALPNPLRRA